MKTKLLILFLMLSAIALQAQNYPHVSIRDIQYVPDSLLTQGQDQSLYLGDTVQVTGVVMVAPVVHPINDRRPIMWAGARWQTYLRDTSFASVDWAGLNVIQNDTSLPAQGTLMNFLDTARIVTIIGVVAEFGQQTQLNVLTTEEIQFHSLKPNRGAPLELTIADLNTGTPPAGNLLTGEKYEGMYVIIRNVITSDRNTTNGTFAINDGQGNQMFIHDQSGYFTRRAHQLRTWDPPIDGTTIQYIKGVIGHFNNPSRYVIRPMYPDDILIGQSPPAISSIRRNTDLIAPNQAVTISATIIDTDPGGSVSEAKLIYRINSGAPNEVAMVEGLDNKWSGTIPGVNADSALVDFLVWAKDNDNMVSIAPIDTAKNKFFYLVLNRNPQIRDVQYSPFGGGYGGYHGYNSFQGYWVTVNGVVTADTSDLQGDGNQISRRVYIQNGEGPWSGIWVFGLITDQLVRGQHITVSGKVVENFNHTRIDSITSLIINSSNNPLPPPHYVSTTDIGTKTKGTVSAEKWEGVLIKYEDVSVTDDNADGQSGPGGGGNSNFGEILVADPGNVNTRVELQEGNHRYHNQWIAGLDSIPGNIRIWEGDKFDELIGVLFYSFGNYKLVPRKDDDFIGYTSSADDLISTTPETYQLMQNYPNPFNPVTTIEYRIPEAGFVQVKIYDILGREVKSLVNIDQSPGSYKVLFNASDLSSGVYFYQIKAGNFLETKKMILMK